MLTDERIIAISYRNWILAILALIILSAGIGLRDPWPADEPRFALIAKQMIETKEWLLPMRGGELYADKPPLFMWSIAISTLATGSLKTAFLLPSLLAGLLILVLTWDLGRRLWNNDVGFVAALMLLFTVQFTLQSKTAQIDALLTLFTTLGIYSFFQFLLLNGGWRWYYLGWFFAGLGIITKGVGFLAALILIPAIWTHYPQIRRTKFITILKATLLGPLAMLMAISLWLLPMLWITEQATSPLFKAYRNDILFHQTLTRYAHSWTHIKPAWFYIINVIPIFWLPLSLLLPWLLPQWRKAIRYGDRRVIILFCYLLLVIVFFSASPGKRGCYLMPATPALALLAAPWVMTILRNHTWPRRLLQGVSWFLVFLGLAGVCALLANDKFDLIDKSLSMTFYNPIFFLSFGLLFINVLLKQAPLFKLLSSLAFIWLCYSILFYPKLNDLRTPRSIMTKVAERVPKKHSLLIVGFKEQHLLFSHQPIWHYSYHMDGLQQTKEAAAWITAGTNRWVLGPRNLLAPCFNFTEIQNLGHRHGAIWQLVNATELKPSCHTLRTTVPPIFYSMDNVPSFYEQID